MVEDLVTIELIIIDEEFKAKLKSVISEGAKLSLLRESRKPHKKFAVHNSYSFKKFNLILSYLISQPSEITETQRSLIQTSSAAIATHHLETKRTKCLLGLSGGRSTI